MESKIGDIITIRVGGAEYDTVIDEHGVQRFPENPDNPVLKSLPMVNIGGWVTVLDSNLMATRYSQGEYTQREYAEAKMAQGYSVCGFCDLSSFDDMLLENPLWADEDDNEYSNHTNNYLLKNLKKGTLTLRRVIEIIQLRDGVTEAEAEQHFVDEYVTEW